MCKRLSCCFCRRIAEKTETRHQTPAVMYDTETRLIFDITTMIEWNSLLTVCFQMSTMSITFIKAISCVTYHK